MDMLFESIGYETALIVDCERINNWLVLFEHYLSLRHGHNEASAMRVPVNESESERQLRLNKYGPINQQIHFKKWRLLAGEIKISTYA